jgi:ribonuclease G
MRKNQRRVLEYLKECMREDSAKCTVLGMSEFGLVEMTRQRNRESLAQTLFISCPYCNGLGQIKSFDTTSIEIERNLKKVLHSAKIQAINIVIHPEVNNYLKKEDKAFLSTLAEKANVKLTFSTDDKLHLNEYQFDMNEKR